MTEIYRRYSPNNHNSVQHQPMPPAQRQNNSGLDSRTQKTAQSLPKISNQEANKDLKPKDIPKNQTPKNPGAFLYNFIPKNLYNPETKKILGILSAEDLLLVALVLLFLEEGTEDNPLLVPALIYILLSDYIDLGDFIF